MAHTGIDVGLRKKGSNNMSWTVGGETGGRGVFSLVFLLHFKNSCHRRRSEQSTSQDCKSGDEGSETSRHISRTVCIIPFLQVTNSRKLYVQNVINWTMEGLYFYLIRYWICGRPWNKSRIFSGLSINPSNIQSLLESK